MKVPIYQRQESVKPLQPANESPLMPAGDFGAGIAGVAKSLVDRWQQIQNDTEDARTLELMNKFKQESLEYHENPDKGLYNTRLGYHSQGVYNEADQWLRNKGEDYVKQLKSERAKSNFRKMAREYITQRGAQNSHFEAAQMKKYRDEQADATITNWLNYAERNWNNKEAIDYARQNLTQALELKMRGSGQAAFRAANEEIEDKIAVARVRQAFSLNPVFALEMLNDPDIKLSPKNRAELIKTIGSTTEVYELQAIAQTYAQHYNQENLLDAYQDLIKNYGADKGNKAFGVLSRILNIEENQKNAKQQSILNIQRNNEADVLMMFNDSSTDDPTETQIIKMAREKKISPEFARSAINLIKARENERLKIIEKTQNDRNQAVKDDFIKRLLDGTLTENDVREAVNNTTLKPQDAHTILGYLETQKNAKQSKDEKIRQQEQLEFQKTLDIIINNGGVIPHKQVNKLLEREKITTEYANKLWSHEDNIKAKQAQTAKSEAEKLAQEQKEIDKKERHERLSKEAQKLSTAYPAGQSGKGLEYINGLDRDVEEKEDLKKYYKAFISDQEQGLQDSKNYYEQVHKTLFDSIRAGVMREHITREKVEQMRADGILKPPEYNELDGILKQKENENKKAQEDFWKNSMYNKAQEYSEKFSENREGEAHSVIRAENNRTDADEIIKYFDRLKSDERSQKAENQKQNFQKLHDDYFSQFRRIPEDLIERMKNDQEINFDQALKAYELNYSLTRRDDIRKELLSKDPNFVNLTPKAQEKIIMERMGTTEELRQQYVGETFRRVIAGEATHAEIDALFINGRIDPDDRERLKGYDKKFERDQKRLIEITGNDLLLELKKVRIIEVAGRTSRYYENLAMLEFETATSGLDPHDKNFNERLENIFRTVIEKTMGEYSTTIPQTSWWRTTPAYQRVIDLYKRIENYHITPTEREIYFETADGQRMFFNADGQERYLNEGAEIMPEINSGAVSSDISPSFEGENNALPQPPENQTQSYPYAPQNAALQSPSPQRLSNLNPKINQYENFINVSADNNGVDPNLVKAVIQAESSGDKNAVSNKGAGGLMQLMPDTANELGVNDRFDPEQNIEGGVKYLAKQLNRFGSIEKALWAYNAGPGSVLNGKMPKATRKYIDKIMGIYNELNNFSGVDFTKSVVDSFTRISGEYSGVRTKLRKGNPHYALDLAMPEGTPVKAGAEGLTWTVKSTGYNDRAGNFVTLTTDLGGGNVLEVTTAHLSSADVKKGDIVNSGEVIGKSGNTGNSTGAHLHLGVKLNGKPIDPRKVNIPKANNANNSSLAGGTSLSQATSPLTRGDSFRVSSDQEINDALDNIFGFSGDFYSPDIWSISPFGGSF